MVYGRQIVPYVSLWADQALRTPGIKPTLIEAKVLVERIGAGDRLPTAIVGGKLVCCV